MKIKDKGLRELKELNDKIEHSSFRPKIVIIPCEHKERFFSDDGIKIIIRCKKCNEVIE